MSTGSKTLINNHTNDYITISREKILEGKNEILWYNLRKGSDICSRRFPWVMLKLRCDGWERVCGWQAKAGRGQD